MKKFFAILFILLFMSFLNAQMTIKPDVTSISGVKISEGAYYYPYPAEPGRYVDIYVKVQSMVEGKIENLTCYLDAKYPFSIDNFEDGIYNLGSFNRNDIALMKFKVRISENAVTGINKLRIICKMEGYQQESAELPIYIQSHESVIMITKVTSNPDQFKPNEIGSLAVEIENLATNYVKDITIRLDLTSPDIPFVPVNETPEKRIPFLEKGEKKLILFSIKSTSEAKAKTYKIPLTLTYYDPLGKAYTKSTIISLNVNTEPELLAVHDQTAIVRNNARNVIPISIINRGESKIAFTTVLLAEDWSEDYTVLSPTTYYIGDINSDDSEIAEFELYINTTKNKIEIPIKIIYKDAIGNIYEQKENVEVKVFSKEDALRYGYDKVTPIDPIIIIAAAFVILYLLYRFVLPTLRKKKKTEFNE
ncbi:MAG: hypothetical protein NZ903_02350 [Candidatus Micrarchaeota archaeon]|nr:hypothetical protein [Candidatus Micrarchaeota archaeon]